MDIEVKKDKSLYYWLIDLFSDAPFVNITEEFPEEELVLPTISLTSDNVDTYGFELGNRQREVERRWYVEVFANTLAQRDEFCYRIMRALYNNVDVYDYDEGFPPDVSPTKIGALVIGDINIKFIRVFPELTERLHKRGVLKFSATYNSI